jgi:thiol-disulfide isomerase/thioredoxin
MKNTIGIVAACILSSVSFVGCAVGSFSDNDNDYGEEIVSITTTATETTTTSFHHVANINLQPYDPDACPSQLTSDDPESIEIEWQVYTDLSVIAEDYPDRRILVFFTSSSCGPCQSFKEAVLSDPSVAKTINTYYNPVIIDDDNPMFWELIQQYDTPMPGMIVLEPHDITEEVDRFSGNKDIQFFTGFLCSNK